MTYAAYKTTKAEWIDEIPKEWEELPLYAIAEENKKRNIGMVESNLLSLSYGKIIQKDINSNEGLLPESFETYQIVEKNDIVLRLTDLQNDKRSLRSAIVRNKGIITAAYLGLKPNKKLLPLFLNYLLRDYDLRKVFYSMGGGLRQSMKFEDLRRLPLIVPSIAEQRQIAAYLNRETAKIDRLTAKQERLIKLLQEKRQAVISRAVTKGLDPNVKMKDSGVEWLGEIPENWGLRKLSRLCSKIGSGKTPRGGAETYKDEGVLFIRSQNVYDDGLRLDDVAYIDEQTDQELSGSRVSAGDVLLNITGASIGRTCIVPPGIARSNVNQHVCIIRLASELTISRTFLSLFLKSLNVKNAIDFVQNGAAREGLNFEQIANFWVPVPNLSEQQSICSQVEQKSRRIHRLIEKSEAAVSLLKEHRQALISAAVTGKIDVRGLVTEEEISALDSEPSDLSELDDIEEASTITEEEQG